MWTIELETEEIGGPMPMHRARIILGGVTRSDDGGIPELSPTLATIQELENYIGRLRKQLDEIERKGRRYFDAPLFPDK